MCVKLGRAYSKGVKSVGSASPFLRSVQMPLGPLAVRQAGRQAGRRSGRREAGGRQPGSSGKAEEGRSKGGGRLSERAGV